MKTPNGKKDVKTFTLLMIDLNKAKGKYKGLHTVYSGFNQAFRLYYGDNVDPVKATRELATQGVIKIIPAKGGAMLYRPEDLTTSSGGQALLKAAGLTA